MSFKERASFEVFLVQIDAVGGEHNLVIPSVHEQIRGIDTIAFHPNYTHSDASVGGMAVSWSSSAMYLLLTDFQS